MKSPRETIYIIEGDFSVVELELLREEDHFVYARFKGERGRGSGYHKYWSRKSKADAYNDAAARLEEKAREYRSIASHPCFHQRLSAVDII